MTRRLPRLRTSPLVPVLLAFAFSLPLVGVAACGSDSPSDSRAPQGGKEGRGGAPGDIGGEKNDQDAGAGGESGGSNASSGAGGLGAVPDENGGAAGAGTEGDATPPEVLSITPQDESTDVERDTAIVIQLDESVAPTSVPAAIDVEGPEGEIAGQITVEDGTITFQPDTPFVLRGRYSVSVGALSDLAGNRRTELTLAEFVARDGRFGEVVAPFQDETSRSLRVSAGNGRGDLFLGGNDAASPPKAWAAFFDGESAQWFGPQLLAPEATARVYVKSAAVANSGDAVLSWWLGNTTSAGGWYTYSSERGFAAAGALEDSFAMLTAATEDGRAVAITQNSSRFAYYTVCDLKSGAVAPRAELGDSDETLHALLGVRSEVVLVSSHSPEAGVYLLTARRHQRGTEWAAAETIADMTSEPLDVIASSDAQGNIAVFWTDGTALWARVYSAEAETWAEAEAVSEQGSAARWLSAAMANGNIVASFASLDGLFLTYYGDGSGWEEAATVRVGPDDRAAVAIDRRGNALAAWSSAGSYRRYVPEIGWQEPASLELTLDTTSLGVFTAEDGSAVLVGTDLGGGREEPILVRFE